MDPTRTVGATERTRDAMRDGRMDGVKTIYIYLYPYPTLTVILQASKFKAFTGTARHIELCYLEVVTDENDLHLIVLFAIITHK